jgi:tetratricopeptide (TPR) repeat protein
MNKKHKKWLFFTALFFLNIFIAIPRASGQQNYNPIALAYFKSSLENLIHGNYERVIADCNQVLRLDPNSAVTFTIRARAFYEMGDLDRAIADSTQAIRLDRNNIGALTIRASSHSKKDDLDRAITDWQAILRINPNVADVRANVEKARQQRGH